jgi:hypothetical protein
MKMTPLRGYDGGGAAYELRLACHRRAAPSFLIFIPQ